MFIVLEDEVSVDGPWPITAVKVVLTSHGVAITAMTTNRAFDVIHGQIERARVSSCIDVLGAVTRLAERNNLPLTAVAHIDMFVSQGAVCHPRGIAANRQLNDRDWARILRTTDRVCALNLESTFAGLMRYSLNKAIPLENTIEA